jgi:hypothetical protein
MRKVLAALDVHTARWIVEKCFKGDLIRGRTILLVVSKAICKGFSGFYHHDNTDTQRRDGQPHCGLCRVHWPGRTRS